MRSGLIVVGVCLLISTAIAWRLKQTYSQDLSATQDVFLGLAYFMEANDGRLPSSEEEFVQSPFVAKQPDGNMKVAPPATSKFNTKVHGVPIADLAPFKIKWGADVSNLKVDERGAARNPENEKVEVLIWPSSPSSGKSYTIMLMDVYKRIKG